MFEFWLHYFVQLVDYVDKKKIESFLEQNFEIVLHIEHKHSSLDQMQPPKSKGKRLMVNIPSSLPQRLIRKTKLAGKIADRIKTRRIELEKFSTNYAKDISYCQYFDEIIDLEESFSSPSSRSDVPGSGLGELEMKVKDLQNFQNL